MERLVVSTQISIDRVLDLSEFTSGTRHQTQGPPARGPLCESRPPLGLGILGRACWQGWVSGVRCLEHVATVHYPELHVLLLLGSRRPAEVADNLRPGDRGTSSAVLPLISPAERHDRLPRRSGRMLNGCFSRIVGAGFGGDVSLGVMGVARCAAGSHGLDRRFSANRRACTLARLSRSQPTWRSQSARARPWSPAVFVDVAVDEFSEPRSPRQERT